jgi:hypothetical protein
MVLMKTVTAVASYQDYLPWALHPFWSPCAVMQTDIIVRIWDIVESQFATSLKGALKYRSAAWVFVICDHLPYIYIYRYTDICVYKYIHTCTVRPLYALNYLLRQA